MGSFFVLLHQNHHMAHEGLTFEGRMYAILPLLVMTNYKQIISE